jgi:hypothetical protein
MKILAVIILTLAPFTASAAALNCKQVGGDKDDSRLSSTLKLSITESEARVTGVVFGHHTTETGTREREDSRGQAVYSGFSSIQDDNADLRAYADKALLKGKTGRLSFWLLGDGEDSVTLRYDYDCK